MPGVPPGRMVVGMNLFRPSALLWVCFVALLCTAAAQAQTQPLEASFEITPVEPVANELVTLIDTTKNPTAATLQYAWDLDADDQFDDGTSMAMTHAFPAGQHRVSLRVRRIGTVTQTDTATRTIVVRERHADRHADPHAHRRAGGDRRADADRRGIGAQPPAAGHAGTPVRPAGPDHAVPRPADEDRRAEDVRRERLQRSRRSDRPLPVGPRRQRHLGRRHGREPQADDDLPEGGPGGPEAARDRR